ncbi:hypothetical protein BLA3211_08410 [Burkholderia aenigmatica]|uniref:Uncharacterized protein n=1 Tax=Burkholderia aenigmatica TaxID=2015348 RepID=A0A6J5JVV6_9BURK|nr:hypothetical protein [Burkholderia aenigmatica]CAB3975277.1 hypothetical protein BLA3211_08410 [Burkholderia aenigmatica]
MKQLYARLVLWLIRPALAQREREAAPIVNTIAVENQKAFLGAVSNPDSEVSRCLARYPRARRGSI